MSQPLSISRGGGFRLFVLLSFPEHMASVVGLLDFVVSVGDLERCCTIHTLPQRSFVPRGVVDDDQRVQCAWGLGSSCRLGTRSRTLTYIWYGTSWDDGGSYSSFAQTVHMVGDMLWELHITFPSSDKLSIDRLGGENESCRRPCSWLLSFCGSLRLYFR